jgi:enoyl-CoA hydratase/carnithine racemase
VIEPQEAEMPEELSPWDGRVDRSRFEEYSRTFQDFFAMTRRDGIIELRMHTDGGPYRQSWAGHNAWGEVWTEVGRDPENEVVILTGTGDRWLTADLDEIWHTPFAHWTTDSKLKMHTDMIKLLEGFVFGIEVPTIAAVNGPGGHLELAELCDITLCTPDVGFSDPHFVIGSPPGDGLMLTMQQTMGFKRAAYHAYTGARIDARTALELGMVNEVVSRDDLVPRAWALAEMIMKRPRLSRRLTHALTVQPWRRALVDDLRLQAAHQLFAMSLDEDGAAALAVRYGLGDVAAGAPGR